MTDDTKKFKRILDKFYREYDFKKRLLQDPVEFPHQYKNSRDIEASGFIASAFAYGKVELFKPVIKKILGAMGKSPYDFLLNFKVKKEGRLFSGIRYRFNESDDIVCLLYIMSRQFKKYGSIKKAFMRFYKKNDADMGNGLAGFIGDILSIDTSYVYGRNIRPSGLLQLFPSPLKGSACKRANLFLRWMVRDRDIDFGIWKGIQKNRLVIPLDTHIAKISKCLGFTRRAAPDWKTAIEITESLKLLDPEDPLKYDFALCHHGISGLCRPENCWKCVLMQKG
ncbi:MAG: TIGR02757 family protein [Nitrospirae bacterium]|nr:TIGR02757 family protein [Nitrospirota bacterium]